MRKDYYCLCSKFFVQWQLLLLELARYCSQFSLQFMLLRGMLQRIAAVCNVFFYKLCPSVPSNFHIPMLYAISVLWKCHASKVKATLFSLREGSMGCTILCVLLVQKCLRFLLGWLSYFFPVLLTDSPGCEIGSMFLV